MKTHCICFTAKEKAEYLTEDHITTAPAGNFVLVKTQFDLISAGTELANYHGMPNTAGGAGFPVYPGYSASGIVQEVGPDVTKFSPGDKVLCVGCGHRSWFLAEEDHFFPIPDEIPMEIAATAYVASFSLLGVRKLNLQLGESAMIAGLGLLGQFAAQFARISGATPVVTCDFSPERRDLALRLGADYALDPGDKDFTEKVKELTGGNGPDGVVEVTGHIPALQQALEYIAWQGRMTLLGCTRVSDQFIDFYRYVHLRGIQLIGCHTMTRPRMESRPGQWTGADDYKTFFKYVKAGRIQVDPIVSLVTTPEDAAGIYQNLGFSPNPPLGVLLDWRNID